MARTDGIHVEVLHNLYVLNHAADRHHIAPVGVELVAVGTLEEHRPAVDQKLLVLDLHLAEAHALGDGLDDLGSVEQLRDERI